MRIIIKHIMRSIRSSIVQPLIILFTIAMAASIVILSILLPIEYANSAKKTFGLNSFVYDISVSAKKSESTSMLFSDDLEEIIRDRGQVLGEFAITGFIKEENGSIPISVSCTDLLAMDSFYEPEYLQYGHFTSENLKSSCIISENYSKEHNLSVGNKISIRVLGEDLEFTVEAVSRATGLFSKRDIVLEFSSIRDLLARKVPAISAFGDSFNIFTELYVNLNESTLTEEIADEIAKDERFSDTFVTTADKAAERYRVFVIMDTAVIAVESLLLLIISAFLIFTSLDLLSETRRRDLGIMRLCGATISDTFKVRYTENIIYGITGGLLGCAFSFIPVKWVGNILGTDGILRPSPIHLLIGFLSSVALILVCTYLKLRKEHIFSVEDHIFSQDKFSENHKKTKLIYYLIPIVISFVALFFAKEYKYFVGIITIVLIIPFLYSSAISFTASFSKGISNLFLKLKNPPSKIIIAAKNASNSHSLCHTARLLAILLSLIIPILTCAKVTSKQVNSLNNFISSEYIAAGLSETDKENLLTSDIISETSNVVVLKNILINDRTSTVGICTDENAFSCLDENHAPKAPIKSGCIGISSGIQRLFGLRLGDKISINIEGDNFDFTVSQIVETSMSYVFLPEEMLIYGDKLLSIKLEEGVDTEKAYEELCYTLEGTGAEILTPNSIFSETLEVLQIHLSLAAITIALSFSITLVGILNVILSMKSERKTASAIYRQSGMTRRDLFAMESYEMIIGAICALIISLPAGILLTLIIDNTLTGFGMTLFPAL